MSHKLSYGLSVLLALALHLGIVAALLTNWEQSQPVSVSEIEKFYIEASVVKENPYKAKQRREEARQTERRQAQSLARKKEVALRKAEDQRQADLKRKAALAEAKRQAQEIQREQSRLDQLRSLQEIPAEETATTDQPELSEEERLRQEQGLALAILEEQEYRRAVTDDEKAQAYVSQIQREIVQNWSRPPSARNGMQALLEVRLVPTGEVVDVSVKESSGNDAFDRSAMLAVRKAERFVVPTDSRQFERNFRAFEVLFRPEDLRL